MIGDSPLHLFGIEPDELSPVCLSDAKADVIAQVGQLLLFAPEPLFDELLNGKAAVAPLLPHSTVDSLPELFRQDHFNRPSHACTSK